MGIVAGTRIGVWGVGVTGRSIIRYIRLLHGEKIDIGALDRSQAIVDFLQDHRVTYYGYDRLDDFFRYHKVIVPSPGIDVTPYRDKCVSIVGELDMCAHACPAPIIAVTGSVGKTTVVSSLATALEKCKVSVSVGGNIGNPMLDIIADMHAKEDAHEQIARYVLLEVSSFQLEHAMHFAPDIAVVTSLYPNHLDRHRSFYAYGMAKLSMVIRQNKQQRALLPIECIPLIGQWAPALLLRPLSFFSLVPPSLQQMATIGNRHMLFFVDGDTIVRYYRGEASVIARGFPRLGLLPINELILVSTLTLLDENIIGKFSYELCASRFSPLAHRIEYVGTHDRVHFYNDSKSTVPESTLAAVNSLVGCPIILLLGGLSKGIDRRPLIKQLASLVECIVCFGDEADRLYHACCKQEVPACRFDTLQEAFSYACEKATPGTCILLSPAGASFDLFNDYQERGNCFKALVAGRKKQ